MTDKILPQIEDWQNRPLDEVYPILYIDAKHIDVLLNSMNEKELVVIEATAEGIKKARETEVPE